MLPGMVTLVGFTAGGAAGSLDAVISSEIVTKTVGSTGAPKTATTAAVTVTPSGGAGGYTYAWVRTSGDAAITANSAAAASTTFSATLTPEDSRTAVFTCTVTDANGAKATVTVTVTIAVVFIG